MIKCVCGCDPEVCACAFQKFHVPPPDSEKDRIDFEDKDWEDYCKAWEDLPQYPDYHYQMPTDD